MMEPHSISKIAQCDSSEEDFKFFVARCRWWLQYFSLAGWDVGYAHEDLTSDGNDAMCQPNSADHMAVITLSTKLSESGPSVISRLAFHEVVELLITDLDDLARDRYTTEQALTTARHSLIRTLENTLFMEKERMRLAHCKKKKDLKG